MKWKKWNKDKPPKGIILVMFVGSKVFPDGAVVQAHANEVLCGVIGDKNPAFWLKSTLQEFKKAQKERTER